MAEKIQAWRCDGCGLRGAVRYVEEAGAYAVIESIRDDHTKQSAGNCPGNEVRIVFDDVDCEPGKEVKGVCQLCGSLEDLMIVKAGEGMAAVCDFCRRTAGMDEQSRHAYATNAIMRRIGVVEDLRYARRSIADMQQVISEQRRQLDTHKQAIARMTVELEAADFQMESQGKHLANLHAERTKLRAEAAGEDHGDERTMPDDGRAVGVAEHAETNTG
jgi:hypothetical protein